MVADMRMSLRSGRAGRRRRSTPSRKSACRWRSCTSSTISTRYPGSVGSRCTCRSSSPSVRKTILVAGDRLLSKRIWYPTWQERGGRRAVRRLPPGAQAAKGGIPGRCDGTGLMPGSCLDVTGDDAPGRSRSHPSRALAHLGPVLVQALEGHALGQGDAGDAAGLRAGHVAVAGGQQVLGRLRGLAAARVPRHHHHPVLGHGLQQPPAVLGDGQRRPLPLQPGQPGEALLLREVQVVQQAGAELGQPRPRHPARPRLAPHRQVDAVAGVVGPRPGGRRRGVPLRAPALEALQPLEEGPEAAGVLGAGPQAAVPVRPEVQLLQPAPQRRAPPVPAALRPRAPRRVPGPLPRPARGHAVHRGGGHP